MYLLDEATASVDFATDTLIQTAIRSELEGVTLITIGSSPLPLRSFLHRLKLIEYLLALPSLSNFLLPAHRLRSILDYDRILVLSAGKVVSPLLSFLSSALPSSRLRLKLTFSVEFLSARVRLSQGSPREPQGRAHKACRRVFRRRRASSHGERKLEKG